MSFGLVCRRGISRDYPPHQHFEFLGPSLIYSSSHVFLTIKKKQSCWTNNKKKKTISFSLYSFFGSLLWKQSPFFRQIRSVTENCVFFYSVLNIVLDDILKKSLTIHLINNLRKKYNYRLTISCIVFSQNITIDRFNIQIQFSHSYSITNSSTA